MRGFAVLGQRSTYKRLAVLGRHGAYRGFAVLGRRGTYKGVYSARTAWYVEGGFAVLG